PLAEVRVAGEGNDIASSERLMGGGLSRRMRYLSHQEHERADGTPELEVAMRDPETSLTVITTLTAWPGMPVLRWRTEARNDGERPVDVQLLSSIALGGISGQASDWWDAHTVGFARNSWFREAVWQHAAPA